MNTPTSTRHQYFIPLAILVAGGLVAAALFLRNPAPPPVAGTQAASPQAAQPSGSTDNIRAVAAADHVRGDPDAPVKVVEYSDFECPFCKRFHTTMNRVMEEYGEDGRVAWVYRHFPLDQLHPVKARREAVVAECVNELAGNDAFWAFADRFFAVTPSNNQTDLDTVIPTILEGLGVSFSAVEACAESGKYDEHIESDIADAIATGGRGTPWSVVVGPDGSTFPLSGAQPYASVRQLVELALRSE